MKESFNILVIGYGNTLRRDDGVGPKVAEAIATRKLPGVRSIAVTQLTPELAETVSQARLVIFVDAAVDAPRKVRLRPLSPATASQPMAHAADPSAILAFARDLFSRAPEAWWLTIPAADLGFGEDLSPLTRRGFQTALRQIQALAVRSGGQ